MVTHTNTFTNTGSSPATIYVEVSNSMLPFSVPFNVIASIDYTLTDIAGDGVSITPVTPLFPPLSPPLIPRPEDGDAVTEIQVLSLGDGVTLTNMGVDVGLGASAGLGAAGATYPYSFTSGPLLVASGGPFTEYHLNFSFMLSGNDSVQIVGSFTLSAADPAVVPEPGSVALLVGFGLSGAAFLRKRRR